MAGHQGAIFHASKQQPQQLQQHHTGLRCVCKELCVLRGEWSPLFIFFSLLPLTLLRESSFWRGDAVISAALSMLPLPSTCRTKLNPAVNTVGKENDFNLCKSVIKRWAGDFSCFQRNAGLIYDFIREPTSRELPAPSQHLSSSLPATGATIPSAAGFV